MEEQFSREPAPPQSERSEEQTLDVFVQQVKERGIKEAFLQISKLGYPNKSKSTHSVCARPARILHYYALPAGTECRRGQGSNRGGDSVSASTAHSSCAVEELVETLELIQLVRQERIEERVVEELVDVLVVIQCVKSAIVEVPSPQVMEELATESASRLVFCDVLTTW